MNVFNELIVSEVSLTVLKTFNGFVYSFTKFIACDHEKMKGSKVFKK